MGEPMHLTVVEQSSRDRLAAGDRSLERLADRVEGSLRARDLPQVVEKVLDRVGDGPLERLDLAGHGGPGVLSMGMGHDGMLVQSLFVSACHQSFMPLDMLRPAFGRARDPELRLLGCSTGRGFEGRLLVYALSHFLGIRVAAAGTGLNVEDFDARGVLETRAELVRQAPGACLCATDAEWVAESELRLRPIEAPPLVDAGVEGIDLLRPLRDPFDGAVAGAPAFAAEPVAAFVDAFAPRAYEATGLLARTSTVVRVARRHASPAEWSLVWGDRALMVSEAGRAWLHPVRRERRADLAALVADLSR